MKKLLSKNSVFLKDIPNLSFSKIVRTIVMIAIAGIVTSCASVNSNASFSNTKKIEVTINQALPVKSISPYIFGVNDGVDLNKVQAGSIRFGGNRTTAYNWETNKSNAGSDWKNSSDNYLIQNIRSQYKRVPGGPALDVSQDALEHNVPYTLLTLQMAGYVANKDGLMTKDNVLDSQDWCKIVNHKNDKFVLSPDKSDNTVYTDEYLNYLGETIGKSDSQTGFKGYALDNEPALWQYTHSLIQRTPITAEELLSKSIDLAATVKEFDENAEIFGPCLFGYSAYDSLGTDWPLIKVKSLYRYNWFIDYYLDKMKEAETQSGKRLLDVLDLHYYTEAKGACGTRKCNHYDNEECIKARINAVRSLYDPDYKEKSWIVDSGAQHFPLLPKLKKSIDTFYPGTKLAFSEYDFGGGTDISGAIAQVDFLGILAEYEVYFASIWSFDKNDYQLAGINIFTDYDGNGSRFGDYFLSTNVSDDYAVSAFAATSKDDDKLRLILSNKEVNSAVTVSVNLGNPDYKFLEMYTLDKSSSDIKKKECKIKVREGKLTVTLDPLTVNEFVLSK